MFNATNVYLTLRQSIKLLIIEYQKGHTSYEERAHFLVLKKRAPVPSPLSRPQFPCNGCQFQRQYCRCQFELIE